MDDCTIRLECLRLAHGAGVTDRDAINLAMRLAAFVLHGKGVDDKPKEAELPQIGLARRECTRDNPLGLTDAEREAMVARLRAEPQADREEP